MRMGNVGRSIVNGSWCVAIIILLILGILLMLVHPRVFSNNTYIDTNSGDIRKETTFFGLRVWDRIITTRFSREVRRLGISAPKGRAWQLGFEQKGKLMGRLNDLRFGYVAVKLELLMGTIAHGELTDQELRVILQRVLASLNDSQLAMREISAQLDEMERKIEEQRRPDDTL